MIYVFSAMIFEWIRSLSNTYVSRRGQWCSISLMDLSSNPSITSNTCFGPGQVEVMGASDDRPPFISLSPLLSNLSLNVIDTWTVFLFFFPFMKTRMHQSVCLRRWSVCSSSRVEEQTEVMQTLRHSINTSINQYLLSTLRQQRTENPNNASKWDNSHFRGRWWLNHEEHGARQHESVI